MIDCPSRLTHSIPPVVPPSSPMAAVVPVSRTPIEMLHESAARAILPRTRPIAMNIPARALKLTMREPRSVDLGALVQILICSSRDRRCEWSANAPFTQSVSGAQQTKTPVRRETAHRCRHRAEYHSSQLSLLLWVQYKSAAS